MCACVCVCVCVCARAGKRGTDTNPPPSTTSRVTLCRRHHSLHPTHPTTHLPTPHLSPAPLSATQGEPGPPSSGSLYLDVITSGECGYDLVAGGQHPTFRRATSVLCCGSGDGDQECVEGVQGTTTRPIYHDHSVARLRLPHIPPQSQPPPFPTLPLNFGSPHQPHDITPPSPSPPDP